MTMTAIPSMRRITLNLARSKVHPDGSVRHGYTFVAPLDENGRIEVRSWHDHRGVCVVRRFWEGEPDQRGVLVHRAGGVGGATWGFDYNRATDMDDEAGFRFGDHVFAPGEYVSISDPDGEMHTFKIVTVVPA
jgi:hypothetical protein